MDKLPVTDYDVFAKRSLVFRKQQSDPIAGMSNALTRVEQSFSNILAYTKNIIRLTPQIIKPKQTKAPQMVANTPMLNTDGLIGQLALVDKQIAELSDRLRNLDLSSQGDSDIDIDIGKKKRRGRIKKGGLPKAGKILGGIAGIAAIGFDITDRMDDDQSAGQIAAGVGGGIAGGVLGTQVGSALGRLAGPGSALASPIGGLIGGALGYVGGGYAGDKAYNYFFKNTEKHIENSLYKNQADGIITPNEPSYKFAEYLKLTTDTVARNSAILATMGAGGLLVDQASQFAEGFAGSMSGEGGMSSNDAVRKAMEFFQSQGWTKEQAAGIVGNLQVESGNFAADVISGKRRGDSGKAVGIAQWHPDRQAIFQKVMGKSLVGSSLMDQLKFIQYELNNNEKRAGNILRTATTAEDAAYKVDKFYERSSGEARKQRIVNAVKLVKGQTIAQTAGSVAGSIVSTVKEALGSGNFIHPVTPAILGSRFGPRWGRQHKGQDYPVPTGTPVMASESGKVIFAGAAGGYGLLIKIQHTDGSETRYAHLSRIAVKVGMTVSKGQLIGHVGNTGHSTGPHLHFEILKNGTQVNPLSLIGGGGTRVPESQAQKGTEPDVARKEPNSSKQLTPAEFIQEQAKSQKSGKGNILIVAPQKSGGAKVNIPSKTPPLSKPNVSSPAKQYRQYFGN